MRTRLISLLRFVAVLGLCACGQGVKSGSASTFLAAAGDAENTATKSTDNQLDLSTLPHQVDEAGRTYVEVDDMRFLAAPSGGAGTESAANGTRWTAGTVYYTFHPAVTASHRQAWRDAAAAWRAAVPSLTFTEGTGNGNYVYVQNSNGNSSWVGMIGGRQEMDIRDWNYKFIIAHEIGHALGLIHEHCRSDRNSYINVLWNNIESGHDHNFSIEQSTTYGGYDFDSTMHYEKNAFSRNGQNTMEPRPPYAAWLNTMGQITHLSQLDKSGMAQRYTLLNDNFSSAKVITGFSGIVLGNNVAASQQVGEPRHAGLGGGRSIWYRWTAPDSDRTTFDTYGSDFDTVLAVYRGNAVNALTEVASNDDAGSLQSRVVFNAIQGAVYYIAVDGYGGAAGDVRLNWITNIPFVQADLNGDGKSDILWQNNSTGQRAVWLMNGTRFSSSASLGTLATSWDIVGSGDFNGDGRSDILWQDTSGARAIWLMNGTSLSAGVSLGTVTTSWEIAGSGDFNGDNKGDILWQDNATGQRAVWLMNGTRFSRSVGLGTVATSWKIVGSGDFNGDEKSDILWQNSSGARAIWLMNGTTLIAGVGLGNVATSWDIAGSGDFNGDGKADILWQDASGARAIWLMNGTTFSSSVGLGTTPGMWEIRNY